MTKTCQTPSSKLRLPFYKALYINSFNRFAYFCFLIIFSSAKRKKQRKPTTKANYKFFSHTIPHAFLPKNLQFAPFVDSSARASIRILCFKNNHIKISTGYFYSQLDGYALEGSSISLSLPPFFSSCIRLLHKISQLIINALQYFNYKYSY